MTTTLTIRLNESDEQALDRLIRGVQAHRERQPRDVLTALAPVTRSSALRDLLRAWEHGLDASAVFSGPTSDEGSSDA